MYLGDVQTNRNMTLKYREILAKPQIITRSRGNICNYSIKLRSAAYGCTRLRNIHEVPWGSTLLAAALGQSSRRGSADVVQRRKMATGCLSVRDTANLATTTCKKRSAAMVPTLSSSFSKSALFVLSVALMLQAVLGDGKTLVLLDNPNIRDTHSIFFRSLAGELHIL